MNFKSILEQLDQFSEATKETPTGRVHTAEPGGYGRQIDTDEEGEEKDVKSKFPTPKRGRGRPKLGSDESGNVPKYEFAKSLQDFMVGNLPGGKLPGKPGKKYKISDVESSPTSVSEQQVPVPVVKRRGDSQSTETGFINIDDNSAAGQAMKSALDMLAQQRKAQIVMPDIKPAAGSTGQAPAGQQPVREKWDAETKVSPEEKGKYAGKSKAELSKMYNKLKEKGPYKKGSDEYGKMRELAFAIRAKSGWGKVTEAEMPSFDSIQGAGLGAGRSKKILEKTNFKPDFLDLDKDGNRTESMKGAAKQNVKEADVEEGNEFSGELAKARAAGAKEFKVDGKTYKVTKEQNIKIKEGLPLAIAGAAARLALPAVVDTVSDVVSGASNAVSKMFSESFTQWDKQLADLLNEDLSVSMTKDDNNKPTSINVNATGDNVDDILPIIKKLGTMTNTFDDDEVDSHSDTKMNLDTYGDYNNYGNMSSMIGKMDDLESDYKDEHDHDNMPVCEVCHNQTCECNEEVLVDEEMHDTDNPLVWKLTSMSYAEAVDKYGEDRVQYGEKNRLGKPTVEVLVPLRMRGHGEMHDMVEESYANSIDDSYETNEEFLLNTISGGLNKKKSTGQSTIPVVASQTDRLVDSIDDWVKLSGIRK